MLFPLNFLIFLALFSPIGQLSGAGLTNNKNDSIHIMLHSLPDSAKITCLIDLSNKYQYTDPSRSIELAQQALNISTSTNNILLKGKANFQIAKLYFIKGIYDKTLFFLIEALKYFEQSGAEKEFASCCEKIGQVYSVTGNLTEAIIYYNKALSINKKLDFLPDIADNYVNIGSAYVKMDSIDKGLSYFLISYMILDSLKIEDKKAKLLIQLGEGYFRLKKYKESLNCYYQVKEISGKNNNLYLLALSKSRIGKIYLKTNNIPAALKYSQESLLTATMLKTPEIACETYKNLSDIYAANQDYNKAYNYFVLFKQYSDSLLNSEKARLIQEMQIKYDLGQKEKENEFLRQQNLDKTYTIRKITYTAIGIIFLFIASIILLVMLIRLIKRYRILNMKLAQQSKELEDLNDQKDKLFSFVAHNLKNPFNTIMGFSELILTKGDTYDYEKMERYAKHILILSTHVHKILENLLEWSRLQRRNFEYKPEKIEIASLIKDVIEMNYKEAKRKEIDLVVDVSENLMVYADRYMINIVLQNLLSNALNFTPSYGKITIMGRQKEMKAEISVLDTGIGIAPEDLSKLFRIDAQPAKIGTTESKGAGLGLVICKEMIQRCNGEISIKSELSKGTTVIFTLPVYQEKLLNGVEMKKLIPDFIEEMKDDMTRFGKLPAAFIETCNSSLLPKYNEVRSVMSLENINDFATEILHAGEKYSIPSFIHFGDHLSSLTQTHQIDKILKLLPEFKKMLETLEA
jgi:signal transduction histidine kinase